MSDFDYIRDLLDQQRSYLRPLSEELAEIARVARWPHEPEFDVCAEIQRAIGSDRDRCMHQELAEAARVLQTEQLSQSLAGSYGLLSDATLAARIDGLVGNDAVSEAARQALAIGGVEPELMKEALGLSTQSELNQLSDAWGDNSLTQSIADLSMSATFAMRELEAARPPLAEADAFLFALGYPTTVLNLETTRSIAAISNAIETARLTLDLDAGATILSNDSAINAWFHDVAALPDIARALGGRSWEQLHTSVAEQVAHALVGYEAFLAGSGIADANLWEVFQEARDATNWSRHDVFDAEREIDADAAPGIDEIDSAPDLESNTEVEPQSREVVDAQSFLLLADVVIHYSMAWVALQKHVDALPCLPEGTHASLFENAALFQFARALIKVQAHNIKRSPQLTPLADRVVDGLNAMRTTSALGGDESEVRFPDMCLLIDDLRDLSDILRRIVPRKI